MATTPTDRGTKTMPGKRLADDGGQGPAGGEGMYRGNKYWNPSFAEYYSSKHERTLGKRLSNWRERQIMAKALRALAPFDSVLDLPSGAGRFLPTLARFNVRTLVSDRSHEMLKQGYRFDADFARQPLRFATSADAVCLPSNAVDVVLCARLIHHLPTRQVRVAVLSELARIARKGVVISFFDANSIKHRRRARKQRKRGRLSGRHGMTCSEIEEEAREAGLVLLRTHALLRGYAEVTSAAFRLAANGDDC